MVSKSTKSIASRIPLDLYFQLKQEADELELNMQDYLRKIIERRNEQPSNETRQEQSSLVKEKSINIKQTRKKAPIPDTNTMEILFSED